MTNKIIQDMLKNNTLNFMFIQKAILFIFLFSLIACRFEQKNNNTTTEKDIIAKKIDTTTTLPSKQAFAKPIIKPLKTLFKDNSGALHYTMVLLKGTATQQWQEVEYPIFEGQNAEKLNDCVLKMFIENDKLSKTMQEAFINNIKSMQTSVDESEMSSDFYMKDSFHIVKNTSTLLSLFKYRNFWDGSAHDLFSVHFCNINPNTFQIYQLSDFFLPNTNKKLTKLSEQYFRKDFLAKNNYDLNTPLSKCCWFNSNTIKGERDNIFYLSKDFVFTPKGIKFVYQNYEIMAFGAGIPEFTIPSNEIRHLLKPEWRVELAK
jgi:Protein of unknown function (DUF3298)